MGASRDLPKFGFGGWTVGVLAVCEEPVVFRDRRGEEGGAFEPLLEPVPERTPGLLAGEVDEPPFDPLSGLLLRRPVVRERGDDVDVTGALVLEEGVDEVVDGVDIAEARESGQLLCDDASHHR